MTKTKPLSRHSRKMPLALAVAASISTSASAFQFYIGDYEASLDTTLTAGASWRMEDPGAYNVGIGNGYYGTGANAGQAKYGALGASINSDDGNLNFEKGDTFSEIIKGSTDFLISGDTFGAFVRARYWYDFVLEDQDFASDGLNPPRKLSKDGADNASDIEIMDAYIYGDFYVGDLPLNVRLGRQVVSWGESTFIFNGINVINPVDIGAIRAPGAEVKDALLPVNMLYGSLGLTENLSMEAFVQLEYEPSRIDDCGTFFSTTDYVADGCGPVYAANDKTQTENELSGLTVQREGDNLPPDTDQFGAAFRWYVPELNDTEFGFYYIQYHSRLPNVSGRVASSATASPTTATYYVDYAEDIKLFGLSFNTTVPGGVSLGGEYSFKQDMPVQLNSQDLLFGATGRVDSPVFQDRVPASDPSGISTTQDATDNNFFGSAQEGYDRFDISQLQFTGISFIDQIWGASRLALVGEVGATYVHDLPDVNTMRYGRYDQAGFAPTALTTAPCSDRTAICSTDGYVTDFSWGYRMRAALTYNDVFAGVNLTPQLAFSHDVKGHAPGPGANFIEDRQSIGTSLRADYLNQYSATLGYTTFYGNSRLNALHDRDNLQLSVSYAF